MSKKTWKALWNWCIRPTGDKHVHCKFVSSSLSFNKNLLNCCLDAYQYAGIPAIPTFISYFSYFLGFTQICIIFPCFSLTPYFSVDAILILCWMFSLYVLVVFLCNSYKKAFSLIFCNSILMLKDISNCI